MQPCHSPLEIIHRVCTTPEWKSFEHIAIVHETELGLNLPNCYAQIILLQFLLRVAGGIALHAANSSWSHLR